MGDELSTEQAKKLADELSALSKLQSEALEAATYIAAGAGVDHMTRRAGSEGTTW